MLMTFIFDIFDTSNLLMMIIYLNDFFPLLVLFFKIALFGGLICFSSGRIAKEVLDISANTVGIVAGSTIIYKDVTGNSSSSTNENNEDKDKEKKDKNKKNNTNETNNETNTKS